MQATPLKRFTFVFSCQSLQKVSYRRSVSFAKVFAQLMLRHNPDRFRQVSGGSIVEIGISPSNVSQSRDFKPKSIRLLFGYIDTSLVRSSLRRSSCLEIVDSSAHQFERTPSE